MIKFIFQCILFTSIGCFAVAPKLKVDGKSDALVQIKSTSPEARRSAILLLGKFEDSVSITAIVNALGDSDAAVRYSALSAISEYLMVNSVVAVRVLQQVNQRNHNRTIGAVFKMVGDSDVDNRRLASKLAVLIGRYMGFLPQFLPASVQQKVLAGYQDSDAIVRFNMFRNYPSLSKITPNSVLLKGLTDSDSLVQKEALEKLVNYQRTFAGENLGLLMETTNESSRLFIMQRFQYNTRQKPVALAFAKLLTDANPIVAGYAMYGLALIKQYPTVAQLNKTLDAIGPKELQLGQNIINSVGRLSQFKEWISQKYKEKDYPFHKAIVPIYIQLNRNDFSVEELVGWLDQPDQNISRMVSYVLRTKRVSLSQLLPLVDSEYQHTRLNLITIAYHLVKKDKAELLSLLILDDDLNIQRQALQTYGRLKLEDYLVYAEGGLTELDSPMLVSVALEIFLKEKVKLIEMLKVNGEFKSMFKKAIRVCPRVVIPVDVKTTLVEAMK